MKFLSSIEGEPHGLAFRSTGTPDAVGEQPFANPQLWQNELSINKSQQLKQTKNQMPRSKRRLLGQRKELVQRYVRLTLHRKFSRLGFALARRFVRLKLRWTERKRARVLASTMETVAFEAARVRKSGFEAAATVLNLGLFFLIADRDIQAMKIDALTHPDPWKRSLAARIVLLTIHELDMDKVAGNRLRQALQDGNVPEELRNAVTEAMRVIRRAQARAQYQFAYLRNSTIGHRDPDAIRQHRDIVDIGGLEVIKVAAEFYDGTHLFLDVLPRLVTHLGTWPGLLAQLAAQSARQGADDTETR